MRPVLTPLDGVAIIGTDELADGSVTSAKIADGTISTGDIANLAVTTGKLADNSVTTVKIVDGTIMSADINPTQYEANASPTTLALRYTSGRLQVGDGVAAADAVNFGQLQAYIAEGWGTIATAGGFGPPGVGALLRYHRIGNAILLSGGFARTSGAGPAVVATLPVGFRPGITEAFYSSNGGLLLTINNAGVLTTGMTSGQEVHYQASFPGVN